MSLVANALKQLAFECDAFSVITQNNGHTHAVQVYFFHKSKARMRLLISEMLIDAVNTLYTHITSHIWSTFTVFALNFLNDMKRRAFSTQQLILLPVKTATFITVFRISVLVQRNIALCWLIQTETARTKRLSIKSTDLVTILTVQWTRYNGMLLHYWFKSILARRKWGAAIDCMNCE